MIQKKYRKDQVTEIEKSIQLWDHWLATYSGTYFLPSFPFTELWIFGNLNDIWALAPELKIPFINVKGGIDWMCICSKEELNYRVFIYAGNSLCFHSGCVSFFPPF